MKLGNYFNQKRYRQRWLHEFGDKKTTGRGFITPEEIKEIKKREAEVRGEMKRKGKKGYTTLAPFFCSCGECCPSVIVKETNHV
jgi:hypothetical protein